MKLILTKNNKMDENYKIKEDLNTLFDFENMFNTNFSIYDKYFTNYEYKIDGKKIILHFDSPTQDIKLTCDLSPKNFFLIHEMLVSTTTVDDIILFATVTETQEDNTWDLDKIDILYPSNQMNGGSSIYGFKNNIFNDSLILNLHKFGRSYNSIIFDFNDDKDYNYDKFSYDIENMKLFMVDIVKEFKKSNFYKNIEESKKIGFNGNINFHMIPPLEILNRALNFYKGKSDLIEDIDLFKKLKSRYADLLAEFNIYDVIGNIITVVSRSKETKEIIDSNILILLFDGLLVKSNLIPGHEPTEDITVILKKLVDNNYESSSVVDALPILGNRSSTFENISGFNFGHTIRGMKK